MFYVLEGVLAVSVGDETLELEAGSFMCVPPGTAHTFANTSDEPVRFLNFNTPAGWENYMRDLGELLASGNARSHTGTRGHTTSGTYMAGLMGKVARFAQSPQGRKLAERAKRASSDPKNRQKIDELRGRISRKRG